MADLKCKLKALPVLWFGVITLIIQGCIYAEDKTEFAEISVQDFAILELNWSSPLGPTGAAQELLLLEKAMKKLDGRAYFLSVNTHVYHSFGAEVVDFTCPMDTGTTRMFYAVQEFKGFQNNALKYWGEDLVIYGRHLSSYDKPLDQFSKETYLEFVSQDQFRDYSFYLISCADNPNLPQFNLKEFDMHGGVSHPAGTGVSRVEYSAPMLRITDQGRVYNSEAIDLEVADIAVLKGKLEHYQSIVGYHHLAMPIVLIENIASKTDAIYGLKSELLVDYKADCITSSVTEKCLNQDELLKLLPDQIIVGVANNHFYEVDIDSPDQIEAYINTYTAFSRIPRIEIQLDRARSYLSGE